MKEKIGYLVFPIITLLYLVVNLYMIKYNIDFCKTEGCSLTKNFLQIEVSLLYLLAIIVYVFMIISYLMKLKNLFYLFLFNIFIAESILIFLFYKETGEVCLICLCFYLLILTNILFLLFIDRKEHLSMGVVLLILSLIVNFIILETKILPNNKTMNNNLEIKHLNKVYTILGTETCNFCNKLKNKMKDLNIDYDSIDYHDYENTLKLLDMKTIPVLLIKEEKNNFRIISGEENISKELFKKSGEKIENKINDNSDKSNTFLNQFLTKDGCSITEKTDENCEDVNKLIKN